MVYRCHGNSMCDPITCAASVCSNYDHRARAENGRKGGAEEVEEING